MLETRQNRFPQIKLSVFFPAFNEEENIEKTVEKAVKVLNNLNLKTWEILIINDGSTDQTKKIIEELSRKNKRIRVYNQPNGGYGAALRAGFKNCQNDWIVYTDADGQFDFSEVDKFLIKTDQADYIIGYRIKRNDPIYRSLAAKLWALSVFYLFFVWVKDVDCGFKMINKKVLGKIPPLESTRGAMINAELLIKIKSSGFKIAQVSVHHYPRMAGEPTGVKLNVIVKSYLELLKLWWKR